MRQPLTLLIVLVTAATCCSEPVFAHGGAFRGPGGAVPPGMREPSDPTPPPPPPPTPNTPPVTGTGPVPSMPTTPTSVPTPTSPPIVSPGGTGRPTGRGPTVTYADWRFWYERNRDPIEQLKNAVYFEVNTNSSISRLGGARRGNRTDRTHQVRREIEAHVIPSLLWAMDKDNAGDPDVESAAYLGLAKVATDLSHIEQLERGLDRKLKHHHITEESAALALGLLRRSDVDEQLPAADLDRVRTKLFAVFEDDTYPTRTRGFAALGLGLLGDQPSGSIGTDGGRDAAATTTRIIDLLADGYASQDLSVALLVALGMQPIASFTMDQRDFLRTAVTKGRLHRRRPTAVEQAWCAQALGAIGTTRDALLLQRVLATRKTDRLVARSAAIGLGKLSANVAGAERVALVKVLLGATQKHKDVTTRNFAWVSVAQAIVHDIDSRSSHVAANTEALPRLLAAAEKRKWIEQPFGALAVGMVARAIGAEASNARYGRWRVDALEILRAGLGDKRIDARSRAAFAVALGIARDRHSAAQMATIVGTKTLDPALRGYAAVGLGLVGDVGVAAHRVIRKALVERRSEEMRVQCATALGLLHDHDAVPLLLQELAAARSQSVKGPVVMALARIGDERAVKPLADLLRSKKEQDLTRALACAGLGVVGDMEPTPSLARLRNGSNYRATTPLLVEALSIL